jgi:CelD/BcsL family acetyltransferase involved in cellulose biosynthesis
MEIRRIRGCDLDPALVSAWRNLQASNPDLVSPFFSPEFTRIIATVRDDVEIAVAEEGGRIVAVFPFQRARKSCGVPVGGPISDFQGLISAPEFLCDPLKLAKQCSLSVWDFDHLLTSQSSFSTFHQACEPSPQISLIDGYEAYVAERRLAGSDQIKQCANLGRRMAREIGELRFIGHSGDRKMLETVTAWKSEQYRRTSKRDLFQDDWCRESINLIHATQEADFAGMLSLLFAGDRLVAGHIGMRSRTVWHYWFPAYDPEVAKYSPGLLLLLRMAEQANLLGLNTIDLGKGMSPYKSRLMNGAVTVANGSISLPSLLTFKRRGEQWLRNVVAKSLLAKPARLAVHWARGWPWPGQ